MMKKTFLLAGRAAALSTLVIALTASALQTVVPVKDTAGTAYTGGGAAWSGTAGLGTVVTVIGRYTTDNPAANEAGLGLKVVYDEAKFTGVTVTPLLTNCMIAPPQIQAGGASTKAVLGWIDTAVRNPAGAVGWPYLADPATSTVAPVTSPCLSPNTAPVNGTAANGPGAVNLFQFQGTLATGVGVGGTATVQFVSDGNFSYATTTTPGMSDQTLTITAALPPACNLNVDGAGGVVAFRDGLLILRHLLTFSGAALTAGMTGPVPDATLVANNINAMIGQLDINGNIPSAAPTPFQDGLLLLRMMLGFNGPALTAGMTFNAGNSVRFTSPALINYVNATCGTSFPPGL